MPSRLQFLVLFLLMSMGTTAQKRALVIPSDYPQDFFRNPLDIPIFLAGNFGECRPGHFHSGIDIKTKGKENQPVHAAAEGYVSRIKMEKGGFGHGLYITHPNGFTTLYAHLNNFSPAIQKYVKENQYEKQRWDVDLQLSPKQFPVKKGQLVAWSGNTGASTAPHLHFEIRNTKTEHPLNPELFGLPIADKLPPEPLEIAFYNGNIYENNPEFPVIFPVRKAGTIYKPAGITNDFGRLDKDTIVLKAGGIIGIGIRADDYMEGSDNSLTFYTADLYLDDSLQTKVVLDDIGYDVTRYINAYTDYATKFLKGKWIQCLFRLPGNKLNNIFGYLNSENGQLDISDKRAHKVAISITDDKGNESRISCYVRTEGGGEKSAAPVASVNHFSINKPNLFGDPNVSFSLAPGQLYDDIDFIYSKTDGQNTYSDIYKLHNPSVPIHHNFDLMIKPTRPIPFDLRTKVVTMYSDGKDQDGRAATVQDGGWYRAAVRNFGSYWLDLDTLPPVIKSFQKNGANLAKAGQITFEVKDAATSVKKFSGYIDDHWVCFEQHGSSFFYKFDEHCPKGKHQLVFKAEDESGNASSFNLNFTR